MSLWFSLISHCDENMQLSFSEVFKHEEVTCHERQSSLIICRIALLKACYLLLLKEASVAFRISSLVNN